MIPIIEAAVVLPDHSNLNATVVKGVFLSMEGDKASPI